jgi:protein subunit release factor A
MKYKITDVDVISGFLNDFTGMSRIIWYVKCVHKPTGEKIVLTNEFFSSMRNARDKGLKVIRSRLYARTLNKLKEGEEREFKD